MGKRRIYVAGQMRGKKFFNFPAFDAAKVALEEIGYEVVSPADLDRILHHFDGMLCDPEDPCLGVATYKDCITGETRTLNMDLLIRMDLDALMSCDAVYALPGWEDSVGARAEIAVARWAGKKVFHDLGFLSTEIVL